MARTVLTGVFVLVHNLCLAALQHALLEAPPPFQPIATASAVLVNVALGLISFKSSTASAALHRDRLRSLSIDCFL